MTNVPDRTIPFLLRQQLQRLTADIESLPLEVRLDFDRVQFEVWATDPPSTRPVFRAPFEHVQSFLFGVKHHCEYLAHVITVPPLLRNVIFDDSEGRKMWLLDVTNVEPEALRQVVMTLRLDPPVVLEESEPDA